MQRFAHIRREWTKATTRTSLERMMQDFSMIVEKTSRLSESKLLLKRLLLAMIRMMTGIDER